MIASTHFLSRAKVFPPLTRGKRPLPCPPGPAMGFRSGRGRNLSSQRSTNFPDRHLRANAVSYSQFWRAVALSGHGMHPVASSGADGARPVAKAASAVLARSNSHPTALSSRLRQLTASELGRYALRIVGCRFPFMGVPA